MDVDTTLPRHVVMIGATGAVGTEVVRSLLTCPSLQRLTLLNRRAYDAFADPRIQSHPVDVSKPSTYRDLLSGHETAICTLGVGQPSKMTKAEFLKIDHQLVLEFACEAKRAGCSHFELLGSVGANETSASFYLRAKGTLQCGLIDLGFDRLSLFQPSMILTPSNRYGIAQGLTLAIWPRLEPVLLGRLRKFRGIAVADLGRAIAINTAATARGVSVLQWGEIKQLAQQSWDL